MQSPILLILALLAVTASASPDLARRSSRGGADTSTGGGYGGGSAPPVANTPVDSYQEELLNLVNQHRRSIGRQALCLTPALNNAADRHSKDMAAKGYLDHKDKSGRSPFDRMRNSGYTGFQGAAENIAYGSKGGSLKYETPQAVFKGWMESSGHRTNIEGAAYNQMGIARAEGNCPASRGGYGYSGGVCVYWTQTFGKNDVNRFKCVGSGYGGGNGGNGGSTPAPPAQPQPQPPTQPRPQPPAQPRPQPPAQPRPTYGPRPPVSPPRRPAPPASSSSASVPASTPIATSTPSAGYPVRPTPVPAPVQPTPAPVVPAPVQPTPVPAPVQPITTPVNPGYGGGNGQVSSVIPTATAPVDSAVPTAVPTTPARSTKRKCRPRKTATSSAVPTATAAPTPAPGKGYGKVQRQVRDTNIHAFSADPEVTIFLISLTAGSTGLNLVAGCNVFLVEPWWNPMVEKQAIDRCHRLSQTRVTHVFRFAMGDSIEERVLALQDKKRKLAEEAFVEAPTQKYQISRSARLEDIRALLGAGTSRDRQLARELGAEGDDA
ncbi:hypothetical protein H9P43_002874 [Blastocladiella emersonii ATCC 22665]|nr:hypothetical protein H9P43_002874 [Blastocladiella emersonii ATCC 22665]